jgi:hypothetical protein
VSTYSDHILRLGSQHLAEMKRKAAEFERQLWDAHESLESGMAQSPYPPELAAEGSQESFGWPPEDQARQGATGAAPAGLIADRGHGGAWIDGPQPSPEERTAGLASHGRKGARRRRPARSIVLGAVAAAAIAALVTALVLASSGPGPRWPASVGKVQREIAVACRNPNVASEPSQVNFACARGTRQILWVFSLLTSGNNPDYASIKTGRQGLEPITPAQGGEVAWSLNLHHPYSPGNPIDSLAVAARAINNIIGGATLTAANGKPVVQAGLESIAANCRRYTGSGSVTSRDGFPDHCAKPISGMAGQAYLVADVFQKWVVGAPPSAAQNAAVLFENANNPGDPRVRAILRSIQSAQSHG